MRPLATTHEAALLAMLHYVQAMLMACNCTQDNIANHYLLAKSTHCNYQVHGNYKCTAAAASGCKCLKIQFPQQLTMKTQ